MLHRNNRLTRLIAAALAIAAIAPAASVAQPIDGQGPGPKRNRSRFATGRWFLYVLSSWGTSGPSRAGSWLQPRNALRALAGVAQATRSRDAG